MVSSFYFNTIRRISKTSGFALVASLLFVLVLTMMGVSAIQTTVPEEKMASNKKLVVEALLAAETGIRDGINKLMAGTISDSGQKTNASWSSSQTVSGMPAGVSAAYTVSHRLAGGVVAVNSNGDPFFLIQSTGTVGGVSRTVEEVLAIQYGGIGFDNALAACDGLVINSNAKTNSYSASGQPSNGNNGHVSTLNDNADITLDSNSDINGQTSATGDISMESNAILRRDAAANGDITLDSNAEIIGDATAGGIITDVGSDDIGGNETSDAGTPVATQPCDPLDVDTLISDASQLTYSSHAAFGGTNYNISSNNTDTFTAGNYQFDSFTTDSNSVVTIDGEVVFYINGDFNASSNSSLKFTADASLIIYVTGNVTTDSNTCLNYTGGNCQGASTVGGLPKNLQIYSNATSSDAQDYKITINSNSDFYGLVYAPKAAAIINSSSGIYGSVQSRWIEMSSNGTFTYDEDLADLGVGEGGPEDYTMLYWAE